MPRNCLQRAICKRKHRGNSPLKENALGETTSSSDGLSFDYITEYSYGFVETLNLIIPRPTGGTKIAPTFGEQHNFYKLSMLKQHNMYFHMHAHIGVTSPSLKHLHILASQYFSSLIGFFLMHKRWRFVLLSPLLFHRFHETLFNSPIFD